MVWPWPCDLKINRDHLLNEGNPCTKFGIDQVKGSKDIERTTQWAEKSGLTLNLNLWPENHKGSSTHWGQPLHQVWYWSNEGVKRYWSDNTVGWEEWAEEWFDLDRWTFNLKINRDHLLNEGNPCTKFGIDQVKGSKDIEQTTQWAEKSELRSGLTLTFEHLT